MTTTKYHLGNMKSAVFWIFLVMGYAVGLPGSMAADWTYEWSGEVLPQQQPGTFWGVRGNGREYRENNELILETVNDENMVVFTTQEKSGGIWNGSEPVEIEFSAKALDVTGQKAAAGQLAVSDGKSRTVVSIEDSESHTYQLRLAGARTRLLVDGVERAELLRVVALKKDDPYANAIMFGDDSRSFAGKSAWQFMRWRPFSP